MVPHVNTQLLIKFNPKSQNNPLPHVHSSDSTQKINVSKLSSQELRSAGMKAARAITFEPSGAFT